MTKTCEQCKLEFEIVRGKERNRFCSRSCSAKFNNLKRGHENICLQCGNVISGKGLKFCSHNCQMVHQTEAKLTGWLSGKIHFKSEYGVPRVIRAFLLEESDFKCSIETCRWGEINPSTGKTPLQIDHIDGNASNNTKENLRVLCPNCHSLTSTFGSLNNGNGRSYRYKK